MPPLTRREFMKTFGVGLASLILASCKPLAQEEAGTKTPTPLPIVVACYEPTAVINTPTPTPTDPGDIPVVSCYAAIPITPTTSPTLTARDQLRACWLSFNELAQKTLSGNNQGGSDSGSDPFGVQLLADHRRALDELVAAGELTPAVADLVQTAYGAAEYHVWRSNAPITCYEPMRVDYAPTSAAQLVQQSSILAEMAVKGEINPDTVAMAQKAIQHDLAFETLSRDDLYALYEKVVAESDQNKTAIPSFDQVELEVTADMEAAAKFIVELLSRGEAVP